MNFLPIIILIAVFVLIIIRRIGHIRLPIWAIMTGGALLSIITLSISPIDALYSIRFDLLIFLLFMFIFGSAMEESGFLSSFAIQGLKKAKTKRHVLLLFMLITAVASAFLMNDTVAVIAAPLAILVARLFGIPVIRMLLALCFSVTFGSGITPIGNPQNLLIAISAGTNTAFIDFAVYLFVPSVIALIISYFILARGIKDDPIKVDETLTPCDEKLVRLCKISFILLLAAVAARIILSLFYIEMPYWIIALIAAIPPLLFSRKRFTILKKVDYTTLLFFAAMFVLMAAVWNSGVIQEIIPSSISSSIPLIIIFGTLVSQFVSNVPFVLMLLPILESVGAAIPMYMALSAGCTAAGTLTILGAASTIIIIQHSEKEGESLSFLQYLKTGVIITAIAVALYIGWILLISAF